MNEQNTRITEAKKSKTYLGNCDTTKKYTERVACRPTRKKNDICYWKAHGNNFRPAL